MAHGLGNKRMLKFESGELVDGEINGWPVSFIATDYGPLQGWSLHVAPYTKVVGEEEHSAPPEIVQACDAANDAADGRSASQSRKGDIRNIIVTAGFVPDTKE